MTGEIDPYQLPSTFRTDEWRPSAAGSVRYPDYESAQPEQVAEGRVLDPVTDEYDEPDGEAWLLDAQYPAPGTATILVPVAEPLVVDSAPALPVGTEQVVMQPTDLEEDKPRRIVLKFLAAGAVVGAVGVGIPKLFARILQSDEATPSQPEPEPYPRDFPPYDGPQDPDEPTQEPEPQPKSPEQRKSYPKHEVTATFFGIGYGSNSLAWEDGYDPTTGEPVPTALFGGVDHPRHRDEETGSPSDFTPNHNDCYAGIPYDDWNENGQIPEAWEASYWAYRIPEIQSDVSMFKGEFIKITHVNPVTGKKHTVYAQWLDTAVKDTGEEAAEKFVFSRKNTIEPENEPQIKLSWRVKHLLGVPEEDETARVTFRFVNREDVPEGPWTEHAEIDHFVYYG